MTRVVPLIRVVLPVLVSVLALSACGPEHAGKTAADDYAAAVCGNLRSWRTGVDADSQELSKQLASAGTVASVKAKYTTFFADAVKRTDTLVTAVAAAGAPKVDEGEGYARDLRSALAKTRQGLASAQTEFEKLPANNLQQYAKGAAAIRDNLGRSFLTIADALDQLGRTYPDKRLNAAFANNTDCINLA